LKPRSLLQPHGQGLAARLSIFATSRSDEAVAQVLPALSGRTV